MAALGCIAAVYTFIASFFGLTMDNWERKRSCCTQASSHSESIQPFAERLGKGVDPFREKPRWVLRSMQVLFLLFVAVFVAFLALSHAASPEIINGDYVLNNHGKIIRYISERDYLFLKGWKLRFFASGWIVMYYGLTMHWWFHRQDEWTVVMP